MKRVVKYSTSEMIEHFNNKNNKLFFFCGSGISYASNLPSAEAVLKATCKAFFPTDITDNEIDYITGKIQPEVFYENLLRVTNYDFASLGIWKCLYQNNSTPNLAHLFIVQYSVINNSPIITTNFDLMFEQAAEMLGIDYQVLLPDDNPNCISPEKLYICKIHGSIADKNNNFTPESLLTTMTSITKANFVWIKFIESLMNERHLCFVGYSGRDYDFYPFLEQYALNSLSKQVIWIDKFKPASPILAESASNKRSNSCKAIKLNQYPFDSSSNNGFFVDYIEKCRKSNQFIIVDSKSEEAVFSFVKRSRTKFSIDFFKDWKQKLKYIRLLNKENFSESRFWNLNEHIHKLTQEIIDKNLLKNNLEKKLFYSSTLYSVGEHKKSYKTLSELYHFKESFSIRHQQLLLLRLSQLNHEMSKYDSSGNIAKELKKSKPLSIDMRLMADFLICESLRMNIPTDVYFTYNRGLLEYTYLFYVLLRFFQTSLATYILFLTNVKSYESLNVETQHEFIEHNIRFMAIVQRSLGNNLDGWSKLSTIILKKGWKSLYNQSYESGYTFGLANVLKFEDRLYSNDVKNSEAREIYDLTTSPTGTELLIRNYADKAIAKRNYKLAREYFLKYAESSKLSGNNLNETKAYLGLAYTNYLQNTHPILSKQEFMRLRKVCGKVEGKYWRKYFKQLTEFLEEYSHG